MALTQAQALEKQARNTIRLAFNEPDWTFLSCWDKPIGDDNYRYCACEKCTEYLALRQQQKNPSPPPTDDECDCDTCTSTYNVVTPLRNYTSAERKEIPLHTILAYYFPDALAALARHAKKANDKHNPGEPMYWAREKSSDHLECAVRHLATPDEVDPDTGEIELVGAFWRIGAALQLREEARLVAAGIKPLSGVVDAA